MVGYNAPPFLKNRNMKKQLLLTPFLLLGLSCHSSSDTRGSDVPFSDTVKIVYDSDRDMNPFFLELVGGDSSIYCNAEINGIFLDTVLIDNGFYYSALSPEILPILNLSYTVLDSVTRNIIQEYTCITGKTNSLYMKIGNTVLHLDTFFITPWHQIAAKKSTKAVIGRDFFEKYVVEVDIQHELMTWGNRLPPTIDQYVAIPTIYTSDKLGCPRQRNIKVDGFKLKDGSPIETFVFLDLGAPCTIFDTASFLKRIDLHFSQIDTSSLAWLILNEIGMSIDSVNFPAIRRENGRVVAREPNNVMDMSELYADIILGTDFLRHFNVIFDYKNNMLYLKRNEQ